MNIYIVTALKEKTFEEGGGRREKEGVKWVHGIFYVKLVNILFKCIEMNSSCVNIKFFLVILLW